MKERKITYEVILFFVAIVVAFSIRFINLGKASLGDVEAALALQAKASASSQIIGSISNPLYINLTGDIFWGFGTGNFGARFLPALMGSLLCIAPVLERKRIGSKAAVWIAFLLVFEPNLVAASRQAASLMPAMSLLIFAVIFVLERKWIFAGVTFGLLALAGGSAWNGLVIVGISILVVYIVSLLNSEFKESIAKFCNSMIVSETRKINWFKLTISFLATVVVIGSNFFTRFGNLSGIAGGFIDYFQGWLAHPTAWSRTLFLMLIAIVVFGLFALVFGITGLIKNPSSSIKTRLLVSYLVPVLIVVLYPRHMTMDVAWIMLPLTISAGLVLSEIFVFEKKDVIVQISVSVIFFALVIFAWLNATWILQNLQGDPTNLRIHLAASIGALILLVIVGLLVVWGWSWKTARKALLFSGGILLVLFSFSMTRRAAGLGSYPETSPFLASPMVAGSDLLVKAIGDISSTIHRIPQATDILVLGKAPDSLVWSLRDFESVTYEDVLSPGLSPSFLITNSDKEPDLNAFYRGQKFTWETTPDWKSLKFVDWFRWVALQDTPTVDQNIYLWARNDLFPTVSINQKNLD